MPADASYFDDSSIVDGAATEPAARSCWRSIALHPNYCGELQYFAQFTDAYATNPAEVETPQLEWQIRSDGQPLAPWLTFRRIINPWGLSGFPVHVRLQEGCLVELVVRHVGPERGVAVGECAAGDTSRRAPARPLLVQLGFRRAVTRELRVEWNYVFAGAGRRVPVAGCRDVSACRTD